MGCRNLLREKDGGGGGQLSDDWESMVLESKKGRKREREREGGTHACNSGARLQLHAHPLTSKPPPLFAGS